MTCSHCGNGAENFVSGSRMTGRVVMWCPECGTLRIQSFDGNDAMLPAIITPSRSADPEFLENLLEESVDYLHELKGEWSWRKDEPRNGNADQYRSLEDLIKRVKDAID